MPIEADLDARAERERTDHRGVQREERTDPEQQRRSCRWSPNLLDGEVLHGDRDVVDHTITDVEDRRPSTAAQPGHELRGAECHDGRGQTGQRTERGR